MRPLLDLAQWRRWQWVSAVAVLLAVTLTPLAWIQWQQVKLLEDVSKNQVDSIMWQAYQLERELGRLDAHLLEATGNPRPLDPYELSERYEVFLSRIDLVTRIPRRDLIDSTPAYNEALSAINAFVMQADPLFAQPEALIKDPVRLATLV